MPRKYSKKPRKGGRRLGGAGSGRRPGLARAAMTLAPRVADAARRVRAYAQGKRYYSSAARKTLASASLAAADNIMTLPQTVIGKPKKPTFQERVLKASVAPTLFKRSYQFSAECVSGRKAWFHIEFNKVSGNDGLLDDLTTYRPNLASDTTTNFLPISAADDTDRQRFYVDYFSSKLQFMNSGTNALTGKIHLFKYRRDCKFQNEDACPINPVNLMMYYSAYSRVLAVPDVEATVGFGWNFDTITSNYNWTSNYNMPGSQANTGGVCAFTDHALSPLSSHIKKSVGYYMNHVKTQPFSLKPGQQLNKVFKFHDLAEIARESLTYNHIENVSYAIAVEFQGQVVGAIDTNNLVSTGSAQLSVIRDDLRILGMKNWIKPKIIMRTAAQTSIAKNNQTIINPDSGTVLNGYTEDN